MDASQIATEKAKADKRLKELTKESERAQKELTDAQNDEEYTKISGEIATLEATLEPLKAAKDNAEKALADIGATIPNKSSKKLKDDISAQEKEIDRILMTIGGDTEYAQLLAEHEAAYKYLQKLTFYHFFAIIDDKFNEKWGVEYELFKKQEKKHIISVNRF